MQSLLCKFILILFLFNFQSLRGEHKSLPQSSPSQPLKLIQEMRNFLGAAWYCNDEDWKTILQDIKEGYTIPEIRVSRLIVDKSDKVLEYKYFVVMKKLGEKGVLVSNSRRQTYGVIHYHSPPKVE